MIVGDINGPLFMGSKRATMHERAMEESISGLKDEQKYPREWNQLSLTKKVREMPIIIIKTKSHMDKQLPYVEEYKKENKHKTIRH